MSTYLLQRREEDGEAKKDEKRGTEKGKKKVPKTKPVT